MGHQNRGIRLDKNGTWTVDKHYQGTRLYCRGFRSAAEAQAWLISNLEQLRQQHLFGIRIEHTFNEAAARYVLDHQDKPSIETEIHMLKAIMPYIGELPLPAIHDGTLAPFIQARRRAGRANKTINLSLATVRRILNLAATRWRDNNGHPWLTNPPHITMLPLVGHQRLPRPISWDEQRRLMLALPTHLQRMAAFILHTGVRDHVACTLRWEWEIPVPELGCSVFEVPREHVKGRRRARAIICNAVAQDVIEQCRGLHPDYVFVWRRVRVKNFDQPPSMPWRPIKRMSNHGWRTARQAAGLPGLHVHDLRHTFGMRLREAGVSQSTIADLLWHSNGNITAHYSMAQLAELHRAVRLIESPANHWNKTLDTLKKEAQAHRSHAKVTQQRRA